MMKGVSSAGRQVGERVDGLAVDQDGEEDVRAVGDAGAGHMSQRLACGDVAFALRDGRHEVAEMGVERDHAARVFQVDGDAAQALALDDEDPTGRRGVDQRAGRGWQVDPVVERRGGVRPTAWRIPKGEDTQAGVTGDCSTGCARGWPSGTSRSAAIGRASSSGDRAWRRCGGQQVDRLVCGQGRKHLQRAAMRD